MSTFTEAELRAAVEAAENWGTYVCTHAYTPAAIQRSIAAGVKCIEHGHLMDDATARLMAEKGIWLSMQPFVELRRAVQWARSSEQARMRQVVTGTEAVYAFVKKYKIKTAWGTDVLFSKALARAARGNLACRLTRWYTPAEALIMATSTNAELLALSGLRNPYPGKLGVVEAGRARRPAAGRRQSAGKYQARGGPGQEFLVIMKNGTIYKNTLAR